MHREGTHTGCPTCGITFYSKNAFNRHKRDPVSRCSPNAVSEFRCCDCDREFRNPRSLYLHLAAQHPNFREAPPARTRGLYYCDPCNKDFGTEKSLQLHRATARAHNPLLVGKVGCVGRCKRKFDAPSSLLAHLESGVCKSGITRDKLDNAIIAQDRANIITDVDAVLARKTWNLSLTSSEASSICDGSRFDTPDDSSDAGSFYAQSEAFDGYPRHHTAGGVSLTPDASSNEVSSSESGSGVYTPRGDSTGTVTPTAGVSGSGGIPINFPPFSAASFSSTGSLYTPSTGSTASNQPAEEPTIDQLRSWLLPDGTFECPICPPNTATFRRPSFATLAELQTHMQSPTAHPQLSHGPQAFFPDPHDPPISVASSESGIATPSTIPAQSYLLPNGKYECPLCPSGSRRLFKSLATLQKHMLSPIAHMPKIYHCPNPELLGIAPSAQGGKREKSFATLSGLAQHVESGACQGGRSMFKAMVGFVNEKLADVGMGDMKMIAAE